MPKNQVAKLIQRYERQLTRAYRQLERHISRGMFVRAEDVRDELIPRLKGELARLRGELAAAS